MTGIDDVAADQFGTVKRVGASFELTFDRDYPHPVDVVWASITDPDKTRLWWAESRIDPRVGGEFAVRWLNGEDGRPMEWLGGEILALDPGRLIEITNAQHGFLRWRVAPTPSGTRLAFTNRLTPPEERFVTMSLGGWHLHLDHLASVLAGGSVDWSTWYPDFGPAWTAVHERYRRVTGLD